MKLADIVNGPWAITPEMLLEIQSIYAVHLRGDKLDLAKVEAALGRPLDNSQQDSTVQDGVAVIPVQGAIAKKMNMFSRISGGVSTQLVGNDITTALNDPAVKGIVLNIDSPGGTVDGTFELAEMIYQSRGKKPIVAFSDGMICSAAYEIASACDSIYISGDTNPVGSIGVVTAHRDVSKAEEKAGIKTTEITAGKYKRMASSYEPLTDEGRADIQDKLDYLYGVFVDTVARNRGVSTEVVLSDMADGRVFIGQQAISNGLVDGVSTMPMIISDMQDSEKREKMMKRKHGAGVPPKKENHKMTKAEIVEQYPDAVAEIQAEATAGHAEAIKTATEATTAHLTELITVTMGEDISAKFSALLASGVTAEQAKALNIKIDAPGVVNDEASRAAILAALHKTAPEAVHTSKNTDKDERAAAVAAMVAGGSR